MFVLVACLVIVLALFLWLRSSDVFAVKRITVTALEHVSVEDISQATTGARGVSLLRLDLGEHRGATCRAAVRAYRGDTSRIPQHSGGDSWWIPAGGPRAGRRR